MVIASSSLVFREQLSLATLVGQAWLCLQFKFGELQLPVIVPPPKFKLREIVTQKVMEPRNTLLVLGIEPATSNRAIDMCLALYHRDISVVERLSVFI